MRTRSRPMPSLRYISMMSRAMCDGLFGVVGEARIHFSGDAAGDDGENLFAKGDGQALEGEVGDVFVAGAVAQVFVRLGQHAVDDGLILRHLRGGGDERGVGGGVLGMKLLHRLHVAGVGHDDGELAQLFKKIWHDSSSGEAGIRLVSYATSVPLIH